MRFALRRPATRPVSPRDHRPPGGDVPILWTGLPEPRRAQHVRARPGGSGTLARLLTAPADELDGLLADPGACPLASAWAVSPPADPRTPGTRGRPAAGHPVEQAVPRLGETTERLLLRHLRGGRPAPRRRPALDAPSTTTETTRRERRALSGRTAGVPAPRGR